MNLLERSNNFINLFIHLLNQIIMTILQRVQAPTPKFFKTIRNGGLILATIGTAILGAPIALPAVLLKIAGYLAVAGGVASAVSQATTNSNEQPNPEPHGA